MLEERTGNVGIPKVRVLARKQHKERVILLFSHPFCVKRWDRWFSYVISLNLYNHPIKYYKTFFRGGSGLRKAKQLARNYTIGKGQLWDLRFSLLWSLFILLHPHAASWENRENTKSSCHFAESNVIFLSACAQFPPLVSCADPCLSFASQTPQTQPSFSFVRCHYLIVYTLHISSWSI